MSEALGVRVAVAAREWRAAVAGAVVGDDGPSGRRAAVAGGMVGDDESAAPHAAVAGGMVGDDERAAHRAAVRQFESELESWLASLLPVEAGWAGRWYDGLVIDEHRLDDEERVSVCGWIFHIRTQRRHPFQAQLRLTPSGLGGFTVLFADRRVPEGFSRGDRRNVLPPVSPDFALGDAQRDWMYRLSTP